MLKQIREYFSLKQRRLRYIEKMEKSIDVESKIRNLLKEVTPDMYVDFEDVEEKLVQRGEYLMRAGSFHLDCSNLIMRKLSKLPISEEASKLEFNDFAHITVDRNRYGDIYILRVIASLEYVKRKIEPEFKKRGIRVEYSTENVTLYNVELSIEGL